MAQQMEIAVIALAQLNRAGKGDPDMTSLRNPGRSNRTRTILLIHWPDQEDSTRELIIAKNKEGETGKNFPRFDGSTRPSLSLIYASRNFRRNNETIYCYPRQSSRKGQGQDM